MLVTDETALEHLLHTLKDAELWAFDTEFQRERTYYPRLCLLQLGDGALAAAVDALATIELAPLWQQLGNSALLLHSGRQDLELVWQVAQLRPGKLIDTQIAAGLAGFAPQIGYGPLVAALLDRELEKAHTRTDWTRRPLPDGALEYALDDVRYLVPVWQALDEKLQALGRSEWLAEDCERLRDHRFDEAPLTLAKRLKGFGRLPPEAAAVAVELAQWREELAQKLDRPRRWVVADDLILRMAQRPPKSRAELDRLTEKPSKLLRREGDGLLARLSNREPFEVPQQTQAPTAEERSQLKILGAEIEGRAEQLGIASEVLATRAELIGLLRGEPSGRLASGWRAQALKDLSV